MTDPEPVPDIAEGRLAAASTVARRPLLTGSRPPCIIRSDAGTADGDDAVGAAVETLRRRGYYVWTFNIPAVQLLALHEDVVSPPTPTRWPAVPTTADVERLPPHFATYLRSGRVGFVAEHESRDARADGHTVVARLHDALVFGPVDRQLSPSEQLPVLPDEATVASWVLVERRVRALAIDEAVAVMTRGAVVLQGQEAPWPLERRCWSPTTTTPAPADLSASPRTFYDLPTFSTRKLFAAPVGSLPLMPFPAANEPTATTPRPRPQVERTRVDATALFQSPEWAGALDFAVAESVDHTHYNPAQPQAHRRRTRQPYQVPAARALRLTGGRVLDLRPVLRSGDPALAETLSSEPPRDAARDMVAIRAWAAAVDFPDLELLDDLEFGALNRSSASYAVRIASRHRGAFVYPEQVETARQRDLDNGWVEGPFAFPPVWPCRAVETNVVVQRRADRLKFRITTDMSEARSVDSPNLANNLGDHPSYVLVRIFLLAQAAAILQSTGQPVRFFALDLDSAYRNWGKAQTELWQQVRLWNGQWYLDKRLVFGDAANVGLFARLSNLIVTLLKGRIRRAAADREPPSPDLDEWLRCRAERLGEDQALLYFVLMYIDDLGGLAVGDALANEILDAAIDLCINLGFPIATDKVVRPTTKGDFLGAHVDLETGRISLSASFIEKLRLRTEAVVGEGTSPCRLHDLDKLRHSHAYVALFHPELKPFVNLSFTTYKAVQSSGRVDAPLPVDFVENCHRFRAVAEGSRGASLPLCPSLFFPARGDAHRLDIESDASGDIGWGFVCLPPPSSTEPVLFGYGRWTLKEVGVHINAKELYVTVIVATLLGDQFHGRFVLEALDNTVAEGVARANKARPEVLRRLVRRRMELHQQHAWVTHQQRLSSKNNDLADALSRDELDEFYRAAAARGIDRGATATPPHSELLACLDALIIRALAGHNKKSAANYDRAWRYWCYFCRVVLQFPSPYLLPAADPPTLAELRFQEWTLTRFAFWLLHRFKAPASAAQHVSMVRTRHVVLTGYKVGGTSDLPRLRMALQSISDLFPVSQRERLAITTQFFATWKRRVDWYSPTFLNLTAAFSLAFCGLLRSVEFCARSADRWDAQESKLTRAHVRFIPSVAAPSYALVYVKVAKKRSSNNKYNQRNPVVLPYDPYAPVNACYDLQQLFLQDPVPSTDLARTPLFRVPTPPSRGAVRYKPLTYKQCLNGLRNFLPFATRVPPTTYGLHSLRIGGATALLAAGCPKETIQAMGRWDSEIYLLYARSDLRSLLHWQRKLGRQHVDPTETTSLLITNGLPVQGLDGHWSDRLTADVDRTLNYSDVLDDVDD